MKKAEATQLSDFVKKADTWEKHKSSSNLIAEHYAGGEFSSYSERIMHCAELLKFEIADQSLQLNRASFCRVRCCPVCQWRRSLKWKARAYKAIPGIQEDFPKHRWLFLTLTVKNCPIDDLRTTLTVMHESFKRLTKLKSWYVTGWVKSAEVTKGQDGLAHPHFHCLLMVPPSYFSGDKYLSHAKWGQLWQKSLQTDYQPVVYVTAIKKSDNPSVLIPEIFKYQTKPADIAEDKNCMLKLTEQLQHTRAIAVGGKLRSHFKNLKNFEAADDEAIATEFSQRHFYFGWNRDNGTYNLE
ncbi:MAG TPA: protein rep [Leptolyngbya sp.]|jgi:plasmid rolling circle replication initiator protein Rep|nr:protein rep [Leptolyngbya sp.]